MDYSDNKYGKNCENENYKIMQKVNNYKSNKNCNRENDNRASMPKAQMGNGPSTKLANGNNTFANFVKHCTLPVFTGKLYMDNNGFNIYIGSNGNTKTMK